MVNRGRFTTPVEVAKLKRSKGSGENSATAKPLSVPSEVPAIPSDMPENAAAEWQRLAEEMAAAGRLAGVDRWALDAYCQTWHLWLRSVAAVNLLLLSSAKLWGCDAKGKPLPSADCLVFLDLSEALIERSIVFGLTPRTRSLDHAKTGRPAKPIEQHLLNGDPSRLMKNKNRREAEKALRAQQARIESGDQSAPAGLPGEAMDEWSEIVPRLAMLGLYTPFDRAVLAIGCVAFVVRREADRQIQQEPLTLLDDETGREKRHPLLSIRARAIRVLDLVAKEFGLGPAWRKRWHREGKDSVERSGSGGSLRIFMGSRVG